TRPEKRSILRLRIGDDLEFLETAAAKMFLHLGALHQGHATHFHGAPHHSGRVVPLLYRNSFGSSMGFPRFCFSDAAKHSAKTFLTFSMRKIDRIARKEMNGIRKTPYPDT